MTITRPVLSHRFSAPMPRCRCLLPGALHGGHDRRRRHLRHPELPEPLGHRTVVRGVWGCGRPLHELWHWPSRKCRHDLKIARPRRTYRRITGPLADAVRGPRVEAGTVPDPSFAVVAPVPIRPVPVYLRSARAHSTPGRCRPSCSPRLAFSATRPSPMGGSLADHALTGVRLPPAQTVPGERGPIALGLVSQPRARLCSTAGTVR